MKSSEIRQAFISYFKKRQHEHVPSSRLIPEDDPTLLFANAGMNQFKNTFAGVETRKYNKATSSQKCVRAGGKHNDLDNVGHTARHHTFFEMLGSFSFGDYFKKEAIHYAWDFLINTLEIPKDRLYVTVFETDDEAADIWHKQENIPKNRIFRFGEADNFWRMGDTGPCGPCSEIFYDHGPELGEYSSPKEGIASGDDRYVEIWNLVFMQYFEDEKGQLVPLPNPSIDTGAGLERLTAIMQNTSNNYDTDTFLTIINKIEHISEIEYINDPKSLSQNPQVKENTAAMRVLADHARACTFLIADGVMPSNEGRGYVLRRILRRGIRYGRKLTDKSLLPHLVPIVVELMSDTYPELKNRQKLILQTIQDEEVRFLQTLDQGTSILNQSITELKEKQKNILDGNMAFKLYDTYGFPLDLTKIMVEEQGYQIDEKGFSKAMEEARDKAKASWKGRGSSKSEQHILELSQKASELLPPSSKMFTGYTQLKTEEPTLIISDGQTIIEKLSKNQEGLLVFKQTPFYGESGGQVGDTGTISNKDYSCIVKVLNCTKHQDIILHHVKVEQGELHKGDLCLLKVDPQQRLGSMANHSATHLLHSALRKTLGDHITQAGSLVTPDKLRFDFTHNQPLSAEEIDHAEKLVQKEIFTHSSVTTNEVTYTEAIENGALALFGEKYGEKVRVTRMGDFSTELCGGTHVLDTSWIYDFVITSETGVSSGIRRIEAITGQQAFIYNQQSRRQLELAKKESGLPSISTKYPENKIPKDLTSTIVHYKDTIRQLEKEIKLLKGQKIDIEALIDQGKKFHTEGGRGLLVTADLDLDDRKVLTDITDKLKNKAGTGIIIVVGKGDKSNPLIVSVSKELSKTYHAGNLLKEMATIMGGKGGGRPDFAQGAAPDRSKIKEAFAKASSMVLQ